MTALPKSPAPSKPQALPELSPAGTQRWMETALFGSAPELESLLEKGLDPNSKTPGGTTLLMMAAADPEKVKLLLGRGAEVNAKAKTGFTALMVASVYRGTSASLHLLLEHGAEARPGKGVLFNASPLFFAAMAGDRDNVTLLSAKGAEIDRRMVLLGQFATSPLFAATSMGNADMVKLLIAKGASIREEDEFQMTALDWAVLGHRRETVKALAAAGSNLNHVDKFGYTPLLYAATVNFGDADVLKALLDAGADPNLRAKGGKSALAQARHYQYARIRAALEESGARE
jgi:ankyrin repeat protein